MSLLRSLARDPAYKVRMRAVNVLSRSVGRSGTPAPANVISGLGRAATRDAHRLVRGAACAALGRLADPRSRSALLRAQRDTEPFVRAQADDALKQLRIATVDPTARRRIVLTVQVRGAPEGPSKATDQARALLSKALGVRAPGWAVGGPGAGRGVRVRAFVDIRTGRARGDTYRTRVRIRLSVSTWPEDALRHVLTAEASAVDRRSSPSPRLYDRLLEAAVERAAGDAWVRIQREGT